jgi:predicted acetyltransferase
VGYRRITEEEKATAAATLGLGFGIPGEVRDWSSRVDAEQLRVMEVEDGEFASVLRLSRMPQYWLGRSVPSGQVLSLATSPGHGGRGHGLALLEGMLAELHEAGVPTVTLQPSTARFYRTAGFEFAGAWNVYEVDCEHVPAPDRAYRVRRLAGDDFGPMMKLYEQVAPSRHGAFAREEWWWRSLARPRPNEDKESVNLLVETADGPVGWAMLAFGVEIGPSNEPVALRVRIQDWGWLPGHDLAVLGALVGYRTMEGKVRWTGPDPDPFLFLLPNESIRLVRRRHWMLRLVDLAGALGARPHPPNAAGRVVLRVQDPLCPWNSGTWSLEIDGGQGRLERAGGAPPGAASAATSTIRGLAALFTGFATPDQLVRAGLLGGLDPAGLELLRAAFAGPRPFTAELF